MNALHVAVGVVMDTDARVCIAKRRQGTHLEGYWEFPGGKLEAGETPVQALTRELKEELALDVQSAQPLIQVTHQYAQTRVLLDVYLVKDYRGQAMGKEGQQIRWVPMQQLHQYRFPDANTDIIAALLALPEH